MLGSETLDQGVDGGPRAGANGAESIGGSGANVIHRIIECGD